MQPGHFSLWNDLKVDLEQAHKLGQNDLAHPEEPFEWSGRTCSSF